MKIISRNTSGFVMLNHQHEYKILFSVIGECEFQIEKHGYGK